MSSSTPSHIGSKARSISSNPSPPRAENHPAKYTKNRVQQGITYVDQRLNTTTRKVMPNTERMLLLYRQAASNYLAEEESDSLNENSRNEHLNEIRSYEIDLCEKLWIQHVPTNRAQKIQDDLLALRRLQFYARYGDYAAELAHLIRTTAASLSTIGWKEISGAKLWTAINSDIIAEEHIWKRYGSRYVDQVPTTYAVWEAAKAIGIAFDPIISAINFYADRNKAFHNGIKELVQDARFSVVAQQLNEDLRDLESIMPTDWVEEEAMMRAILETLRDEWFDTSIEPVRHESWIPRPQMIADHKGLNANKAAAVAAHMASATQRAQKRLQVADEEDFLWQQARIKPEGKTLPSPGPSPAEFSSTGKKSKRKASSEVDVQNRKKAWTTIKHQQEKTFQTYHTTLTLQRHVNRVVSGYRAEHGDSKPTSSPPRPSSEEQN